MNVCRKTKKKDKFCNSAQINSLSACMEGDQNYHLMVTTSLAFKVTQVKGMQNDCFAHLSRLGVESKMKTTVVND